MTTLKAPFPWFGGKSRAASLIWSRFGDVQNYVEPFAGSLAVLLARPTVPKIETVNDADAMLSNFWRAVSHAPALVASYADWPVSEPDLHARHRWLVQQREQLRARLEIDPDYYDPKVAGWWVWGLSQWIGGGWCSGKDVHKKRPDVGGGGKTCAEGRGGFTAGRGVHALHVQHRRPRLGAGGAGGAGSGVHRQIPRAHAFGGAGVHGQRVSSLLDWFGALQERLRKVRVCCGDWTRIMGDSVIFGTGITGILLDPPYSHAERDADLYAVETDVSAAVRAWALEHGDDPRLRIALCGYEGEHELPASWSCASWQPVGGYGLQSDGRARANRERERIWFSPHCLPAERPQLPLFAEGA